MGEGTVAKKRPSSAQDAACLAEGEQLVREELQPHLAENGVEGSIRERQRLGACPMPADRGTHFNRTGDLDHGGVHVCCLDRRRAQTLGRNPRNHTGTAREIEHALAGSQRSCINEIDREWRGHGRHEVALVVAGAPLLRSSQRMETADMTNLAQCVRHSSPLLSERVT